MPNQEVLLAFIWLDNMLHASADIENKVCNLLQRIGEKIETDRKEAIQESRFRSFYTLFRACYRGYW